MKLYQTSSTLMKLYSKIFFSLSYDKNVCSAISMVGSCRHTSILPTTSYFHVLNCDITCPQATVKVLLCVKVFTMRPKISKGLSSSIRMVSKVQKQPTEVLYEKRCFENNAFFTEHPRATASKD